MLTAALNTMAAAIIFFWSLWCIFCKHVNDGVFGKIVYSFAALAAFAVLAGQHAHDAVIDPASALTWAMAAIGLRQMGMHYVWPIVRRFFIPCDQYNNRRAGDL